MTIPSGTQKNGFLCFSDVLPEPLEVVCLFQPADKLKQNSFTPISQFLCKRNIGNGCCVLCGSKNFSYISHKNGLHKLHCVKCNDEVSFLDERKEYLHWKPIS